jgi:hypothetical protein
VGNHRPVLTAVGVVQVNSSAWRNSLSSRYLLHSGYSAYAARCAIDDLYYARGIANIGIRSTVRSSRPAARSTLLYTASQAGGAEHNAERSAVITP